MAVPPTAFSESDKRPSTGPSSIAAKFAAWPDPVTAVTPDRILEPAHHAPSAGFMQPPGCIPIRERRVREQVHAAFAQAPTKPVQN